MAVEYVLHDRSILLPYMTRFVVQPLVRAIPPGVSANALTLTSAVCAASGFALALLLPPSRWVPALVAALFAAYTLLDNLDGPHARATGTSSPLGEFLDHWLDSLNGVFVFVGTVFALQAHDLRGMTILALMVASAALTFWEQRVTGRMYMGAVGNLEGLVLVIGALMFAAIIGPEAVHRPIWHGYDAVDAFLGIGLLAGGATIVGPMWRTGRQLHQVLWVLTPLVALLAWQARGDVPILAHCVLAALVGPLTGGRFLIGRVTKQDGVGPDLPILCAIASMAVVCAALRPPGYAQFGLACVLLAWASARVAGDFRDAVRQLAAYVRPDEVLARLLPR